jgi:hypothetical protein
MSEPLSRKIAEDSLEGFGGTLNSQTAKGDGTTVE